ncbi:MAG TPA: glycosyltransferase family 39 protein [Bryobacteraceae bacterium]|nr:glycosyltransferase family 39 protein [Bryobacteraceae bacterium]
MSLIGRPSIRASLGLLLALAYFAVPVRQTPRIYDEGSIVDGADRILRGQVPYRDFNTGYPPAQFYTIASIFSIFGETLTVERIWDALWRMAIAGMAVVLARTAASPQRAHPLLLICAALITGACGFPLYPMITGMLPCLAAVWFALRYLKDGRACWLFFSGLACGAAALYRHDLAACVCGGVAVTAVYQAISEGKSSWLRPVAVFLAGFVLAVAIPVAYFWSWAPHEVLKESFIDFPRINLAARRLPLPGPISLRAWRDFYLPLAIIAASISALRRSSTPRKAVILLLLLTSVATLVLATQRLEAPHAYPSIVFSLVLLCACLATWRAENRRLARLLLSGTVLCYGLSPLYVWTWQMTGLREAVRHRSAPEPSGQTARAGLVPVATDQRQAVLYIQEHVPPDSPLFVGTTSHRLQLYNDALFYFLAGRPRATRFDMFVPGVTDTFAAQSEIARDLHEKHPPYVVLFRPPVSHEPNLSSADSGVTILDDAIRQEYVQEAEFGRYTIWRRTER